MSYTSTYALFKTKVKLISEHRNGHGSGPAIWDYVSMILTGKSHRSHGKDFWPLWKDGRLSKAERAVLLSTYDNAFVEAPHLNEFADACEEVSPLIIEKTDWTWSHFKEIGDDARILSFNHDYRCKGLAIGCTSVCDEWEFENPANIDSWGVYSMIEELAEANE